MPTLVQVPEVVIKAAQRGLSVHSNGLVLEDVCGVEIASKIVSGILSEGAVTLCHRFFQANEETYAADLRELKEDSPTIRSWLLHGGDAGKAWAAQIHEQIYQGTREVEDDDPFMELLGLPPELVYERFADGGWKFVYQLNPDSAAKLVEHYIIANGCRLSVDSLFGEYATDVRESIRAHTSPKDVARELIVRRAVRDPLYRVAVEVDTAAMEDADRLNESFPATVYNSAPLNSVIKYAWPVVIAYLVLACEDKALLAPTRLKKLSPAPMDKALKAYTQYNDATNFIQAFFHPKGKRYKTPTGKFATIDVSMLDASFRAFHGTYLQSAATKKLLNDARMYLTTIQSAGTTFATLLADWKKGNWDGILEMLPEKSDVYAPFKTFVDKGKPPTDDTALQQTPTSLDVSPEVKDVLSPYGGSNEAVPLSGTKTSQVAAEKGTPIGVHSVLVNLGGYKMEIVGAFTVPTKSATVIVAKKEDGTFGVFSDAAMASAIQQGGFTVVQGHADLPGTVYGGKPQPAQDEPIASPPTGTAQPPKKPPTPPTVAGAAPSEPLPGASEFLKTLYTAFKPSNVGASAAAKACNTLFDNTLLVGSQITGESGAVFTIAGVYLVTGKRVFVLKMEDGNFEEISDSDLAESFTDGSAWIAGHGPADKAPASEKFETADDYFGNAFADTINQWTKFEMLSTDSEETFLDKYNVDLTIGTVLADKAGSPFRIEGAYYNKISGATLIVYSHPDGSYNEVTDDALNKGIKSGKATYAPKSADQFKPIVTPEEEPSDVTSTPPPPPAKTAVTGYPTNLAADVIELLKDAGVEPSEVVPVKDTQVYGAAVKLGYSPVSSFMYLDAAGTIYWILAAYSIHYIHYLSLVIRKPSGELVIMSDSTLAGLAKSGTITFPVVLKTTGVLDPSKATTGSPAPKVDYAKAALPQAVQDYINNEPYLKDGTVGSLANTALAGAVISKGMSVNQNGFHLWTDAGTQLRVYAVVKYKDEEDTIVWAAISSAPGQNEIFGNSLSSSMAVEVVDGTMTLAPSAPKPKFQAGNVIKVDGDDGSYIVLAISDTASHYLMYKPHVAGENAVYAQSVPVTKVDVDFHGTQVGSTTDSYPGFYAFTTWLGFGQYVQKVTPSAWKVALGQPVLTNGKSYIYAWAASLGDTGDVFPVLGIEDQVVFNGKSYTYFKFTTASPNIFATVVEPTYSPTDPTPEPASVDSLDVPDAETGNPEMAGTQAAFDYIAKQQGWVVALKSATDQFKWELGDVLQYGQDGATRTIIGYANNDGLYLYVMVTQTGIVNYKGVSAGNTKYGPKITTDQSVINALLPLPNTAAPKFPKLNYALSALAKKIAAGKELVYVPSPKDAAFQVGTVLQEGGHGNAKKLVAWVSNADDPNNATDASKIAVLSNKDGTEIFKIAGSTLSVNWSVVYQHSNLIDSDTGEVVFGKQPGVKQIQINTENAGIPTDIDGWKQPVMLQQPAMSQLPQSGHVSAGVFAVFEPGAVMNNTDYDDAFSNPYASVVMCHPMNGFGGYALTFPKGTVEKGEAMEVAAVREFFEETGMSCNIVSFLDDFKGDTSTTRMYMGYVTGGNPHKAGSETDAVTLKPLAPGYANSSWFKSLAERDKDIVNAGNAWMLLHQKYPHQHTPQQAESYTQVTGPQDATGGNVSAGTQDDAGLTKLAAAGNMLAASVDYNVPASFISYLNASYAQNAKTWQLLPQKAMWKKGYPKVGNAVIMPGEFDMPVQVLGYTEYASAHDATSLIVLWGIDKNANYRATYLSQKLANAAKGTVLTTAKEIKTAPWMGNIAPASAAPADPTEAIWNKFVQTSPIPINKGLLKTIKAFWNDTFATGSPLTQVDGFKAIAMGVALTYGDVYNDDQVGHKFHTCLGYVRFYPKGSSFTCLLSVSPDGKYGCIAANHESHFDSVHLVTTGPSTVKWSAAYYPFPPAIKALAAQIVIGGQGTLAASYSLNQWKQIFKEAGVPNYSGLTSALLPAAIALGVPNSMTGVQHDVVLQALQHNAELIGSAQPIGAGYASDTASLGFNPATPQYGTSPLWPASQKPKPTTPSGPPPEAPKLILSMGSYYSAQWKQQIASLNPSQFKKTNETAPKGTNPTFILEGPGGSKWFAKSPKDGDAIRPAAEAAAYKLLAPIVFDMVPVGSMTFNGTSVSIQPMIEGLDPSDAFKSDPNEESDENKATVLRDHALDMFLTDHDGNRQNHLKKGGKLIRIDRGQAFKFYLHGDGPILDPTYQPEGNVGKGYAKDLLIAWGQSQAEIPKSAFSAMREAIAAVQELTNDQISAALDGFFKAGDVSPAKKTKVLKLIQSSRDSYLDDWTALLKKLRKNFAWPSFNPPPKNIFQADPKKQGFTAEHAAIIQEAIDAGWQGKSLKIAGYAFENQDLMVRQVLWKVKPNQETVSTLIHFRMSRPAGLIAGAAMLKKGLVSKEGLVPGGGPQRLKADIQHGFWEPIRKGIGTINQHYFVLKDGKPNQDSIDAAIALLPKLMDLMKATEDPSGIYAPTGESNEIVNTMAGQYVQYIKVIKFYNDADAETKQHFIGKHTEVFGPFLYAEPPAKKSDVIEPAVAPTLIPTIKEQGAVVPAHPSTWTKGDKIVINALNNAVYNSPAQAQFHIYDPNAEAHIFLNPPANVGSLQKGVEGHKGVGWGIMPGAPSPKTVAHLLKMMGDTFGLEMVPATPAEQEFMYWLTQGVSLQGNGKTLPDENHEAVLEPELQKAKSVYMAGGVAQAITLAKKFTAGAMGVSPDDLTKQPSYDPQFGQYTRGAGWKRALRINWTRDKLIKTFGANVHFAHNIDATSHTITDESVIEFFNRVTGNGALIANNLKAFYAIPPGGSSPSSDYPRGGSQGLFLCLRDDYYKNILSFDISLALRADVYMVGTGDTFGQTGPLYSEGVSPYARYGPEQWKSKGAVSSGWTGHTSHFQINARHDVDLRQYLYTVPMGSSTAVATVRKICKDAGWTTFANGRTVEQVIVVKGKEVP